jgi:uncharacterized membrane protein
MNKKFLSIIALTCVLAFGLVGLSFADINSGCTVTQSFTLHVNGQAITCAGAYTYDNATGNNAGICCLMNIVNSVANWIFVILTAVAVIMIMLAAWTFITNAGDPEKASDARRPPRGRRGQARRHHDEDSG